MNLYTFTIDGDDREHSCFALCKNDVRATVSHAHVSFHAQRKATAEELGQYEVQNLRAEVEALRRTVDTLRQSLKLANDTAEEHMRLRRIEMTAYRGSVARMKSQLAGAVETSSMLAGQAHDQALRAERSEALLMQVRRQRTAQSVMINAARHALKLRRR